MSTWSPGEAGGAFAGIVAVLAVIGKGIAWLLRWRTEHNDTREQRLNKWESSLRERELQMKRDLEAKFAAIEAEVAQLRTQNGALCLTLVDVTNELRTIEPGNPALTRATALLKAAFPLELSIPPGLAALLDKLDELEGEND